ncbi:MAG: lysine--tRNA ligase, partial [Thermoplasmatota archaeon]
MRLGMGLEPEVTALADLDGDARLDVLGEESFERLLTLDLGDLVGVDGTAFKSRRGELSLKADGWTLLAKSLRPLPFGKEEVVNGEVVRHSGFADAEGRSRQRYADLAVHPEVRTLFVARSRMITAMRAFLDGRGFL